MVYDGFGLPINSMVDLSMAIAVNVISPDGKPALVQSQVFWRAPGTGWSRFVDRGWHILGAVALLGVYPQKYSSSKENHIIEVLTG